MILKNCSLDVFFERTQGMDIICFGAGIMFGDMLRICESYDVCSRISYLIDNSVGLHGKYKTFKGKKFYIKPVETILQEKKDFVILIVGMHFAEMLEQLDSFKELNNKYVYIFPFMHFITDDRTPIEVNKEKGVQIPKQIHYCWFGNAPLPEKVVECMETWKEKCPDYEIVRWDESNYDVKKHLYIKQAYENKAWAFVSDYARLDILYQCGGIYLDTDVKLVRSLDELLYHDAYCGFIASGTRINTGIGFGAKKHFSIVGEWLDAYKYQVFEKDDCGVNGTLCTIYQTDVLKFHNNFMQNGCNQIVDGLACYSKEYFDPYNCNLGLVRVTDNTYSIHWNDLSWCEANQSKLKKNRMSAIEKVNMLMERMEKQEQY